MKYLIIQGEDGAEFPVFCCAPQTHADMARAWRRTPASRVVSAGFCSIIVSPNGDDAAVPVWVATYGRSESLNLHPRKEDARLIAAFLHATARMCPADYVANLNHAHVTAS